MLRIPEPELMDDAEQAIAYAAADFSEPNTNFVGLLAEKFGDNLSGSCLDIGCGPGDICFMMADRFPELQILGIDGSREMLKPACKKLEASHYIDRVSFQQTLLPTTSLHRQFNIITSNSLLHHLHNPQVLWQTIRQYASVNTHVLIMDLFRPESTEAAREIVDNYASGEAHILQTDFYNSLLAAFTPEEVEEQLQQAGLPLDIGVVSDRHLIVYGTIND